MKKIFASILTLIMGLSLLTSCGSDAVADEFEKYLNTDMVEISQKYEDLKTETGKWANMEDSQIVSSIENVILPNINESLEALSKIELTTDEVKAIKDKYEKVLDTYKDGFETILNGYKTDDEDKIDSGLSKLDDAMQLLDDYNSALEELAAEKEMEIGY